MFDINWRAIAGIIAGFAVLVLIALLVFTLYSFDFDKSEIVPINTKDLDKEEDR